MCLLQSRVAHKKITDLDNRLCQFSLLIKLNIESLVLTGPIILRNIVIQNLRNELKSSLQVTNNNHHTY